MGVMARASGEACVCEGADLTPFFTLLLPFLCLMRATILGAETGAKLKPFLDITPFNPHVLEGGIHCYRLHVTGEVCGSERRG